MTELRLIVRTLVAQPGFSCLVVLAFGLGIGANTAIFSAVHGLLLRTPPFRDVDRLVQITTVRGDEGGGAVSIPEFDDIRSLPIVEDAALFTDQGMYNASGSGTPEEMPATITTHDLFRVLGVPPLVGSTFPAAFDRTRNFGLIISHGLWIRKFGQDPNIVGRSMTLDGAPGYTIYGVMPRGFSFPANADLYRSSGISANPAFYLRRDIRDRMVLARLKPDVTLAQARIALDELSVRLARESSTTNLGVDFQVTPLRTLYTANVRAYVLLVFGAVLLLLVVACTNVASLLLSRAIARDRDVAIHVALGAGRWQFVRHALLESLVLSVPGAALGWLIANAGVRLLPRFVPVQLPPWMAIDVDLRVTVFLAAITMAAGLVSGMVPALRSASTDLLTVLNSGARGSGGVDHHRLHSLLVVAEVALAAVLLVGASLLARSVWRLGQVDPGFDARQALTFRVELGWAAYTTLEQTTAFHRKMLERLRGLPGVLAVTFDNNLPLSGKPRQPIAIRASGRPIDDTQTPYVHLHLVGPDYFEVMGIPLTAGRPFDERDRPDGARAAILSTRLAERLWSDRDPIGQRLQAENTMAADVWYTVVGVAQPTLQHDLDAAPGFDLYLPFTQASTAGPYYVVRTKADPWSLANAATAVVGQIDPNQSFLDVASYERRIANRIWQRRFGGALLIGFAGVALVLAALGLYSVLSHIVLQQRREIGVRVALGATPRDVLAAVLGRGLALAALGAAAGLPLAFVLARTVEHVLFEVPPADPATFVATPVALLIVGGLACYLPARRAARLDPLVALRGG